MSSRERRRDPSAARSADALEASPKTRTRDASLSAPQPAAGRSAFDPPLHPLRWSDPARWLALGLRDLARVPGIGLFHGLTFMVMGWARLKVCEHAPAYTLALSAGFLLMGPFLCLGLYRVSQRLEAGQKPDFGDSLLASNTRTGQLAVFGFILRAED